MSDQQARDPQAPEQWRDRWAPHILRLLPRAILLAAGLLGWVYFRTRADLALYAALGLLVALVLASAIRFVIQKTQGITIRNRLLLAFIFVALLPVSITGGVTAYRSAQSQEAQVLNQLESVATLKEAEIETWVQTLDTTLTTLLRQDDLELLVNEILVPGAGPENEAQRARLQAQMVATMVQSRLFDEIFVLNDKGLTILSTDSRQVGKGFSRQPLFTEGMKGHYITPPLFSPSLNGYRVISVLPIIDDNGQVRGVLGGRASMDHLNEIMLERAGLGETGETYLVGANHVLVTSRRDGQQYLPLWSEGVNRAVDYQTNGSGRYTNDFDRAVIGVYRWLPNLQVALMAEQDQVEALSSVTNMLWISAGIMLVSLLVAAILAILVSQSIAWPISVLAGTAAQMAEGRLDLNVPIRRTDEIGQLAEAFNSMTTQLQELVTGLEHRVNERTAELERRSTQIQVAAEVARDITTTTNPDELLDEAVRLIRDRFGFYHAGLFLLDDRGEYAVLRAATGEAGRQMLESGHRLKVGAVGIVGSATGTRRPHVALDVGSDAAHYRNPLLPDTRSEMALPLIASGRVIGALDVQSTQPDAFDQQDITVLQTLADQLAVAIENARLIQQMNETVRELEQAYGRYTQESWRSFTRGLSEIKGYRYRRMGVQPADRLNPEARQALQAGEAVQTAIDAQGSSALAVPIRLRGETIGVLNLRYEGQSIPQETLTLAEEAAGRLALVIENSRLLQEAQRLALREQQINLVAGQVRNAEDMETLLQTTVRELGKALGASRTFIHLGLDSPEPAPSWEEQL